MAKGSGKPNNAKKQIQAGTPKKPDVKATPADVKMGRGKGKGGKKKW